VWLPEISERRRIANNPDLPIDEPKAEY